MKEVRKSASTNSGEGNPVNGRKEEREKTCMATLMVYVGYVL
jgi:hypothetical protein